jgi:hypothetical protein
VEYGLSWTKSLVLKYICLSGFIISFGDEQYLYEDSVNKAHIFWAGKRHSSDTFCLVYSGSRWNLFIYEIVVRENVLYENTTIEWLIVD